MADDRFSQDISVDQSNHSSDKSHKVLKQLEFKEILNRKVNMNKINLDVIKPWIAKHITDILGAIEDDVVIKFVFNQLDPEKFQYPDARMMQINLTGFLGSKNACKFVSELWTLLIDAEESTDGIPTVILDQRKEMR